MVLQKPMRILIADDHEMIRTGLRTLFERREDWEIVGEALNGEEAIALAGQTDPHVAVIDYQLPGMNGPSATREIRARIPTTQVVMFTMHDDPRLVANAFEAGARGYVTKSEANDHLLLAVEALADGKPYVSEHIQCRLTRSFNTDAKIVNHLTPGERVISQLISDKHTDQDIAHLFRVSPQSVEGFRSKLLKTHS
jgi:DNA-binding NarL/FixJ family response regulator